MRTLRRTILLSAFAAAALAGCADAGAEPFPDAPIAGADRDAHGCIPSAGYVWSDERQDCVRPWEATGPVEPADETIHELGLITRVEDGPYPMMALTVEFPERQFSQSFSLNLEAVDVDPAALGAAAGRYADFDYTSAIEPALLDMLLDGQSLLGEYAITLDDPERVQRVTGILSGAQAATESDLPGEFTITDDQGTALRFVYFIPDEFVPANGKRVSASYVLQGRDRIVRIELR